MEHTLFFAYIIFLLMEDVNRKDNRLLSSLTDLKLDNIKGENHNDEVHIGLCFRLRESQEKLVLYGPSMIPKSIRILYRSLKKRPLEINH